MSYLNGPDQLESSRPSSVLTADPSYQLSSGRFYDSRQSQAVLGARRPRPHKIWKKKFIKVLVVGDSGLGKTTLIKTLLSTPGERLSVHDGTFTPTEQFIRDPESLCSTVTWKDEEDRVIWVYRIQDTPGYGDELNIMNTINMMLGYIEKQNQKWLELESARDRQQDLSEAEDPRVDVVLYCVPPHRLRPIDLRYMFELSKSVPIIPVITKADTMTTREANTYRTEVSKRIMQPNLAGIRGRIDVFKFDKDTLERAGLSDVASAQTAGADSCTPPFLVVASNDINEDLNQRETPVFWPERRYAWGTAEAFNPDHSDLLQLRALLLKEALEEIVKSKRQRYEEWRRRTLGGAKIGRKLRRLVLWTVIPVAAAVHVGRHGFSIKDIKASVRKNADRVRSVRQRAMRLVRRRAPLPPPPPPVLVPSPVVPAPIAAEPEPIVPVPIITGTKKAKKWF